MEEKLKVGKIYKIIDNTNDNIYIGSTTQTLNQRINNHKCDYNRYLNGKHNWITSFDIIKNNNYRFEIIKYIIYKDKIELHQRERYYIENNNCINKYVPARTLKEYLIDNKEIRNEYSKQYRNDNKEYIREQGIKYRNDNKEQIKQRTKKYRNDNKERRKIKYQCECGSSIRIDSKSKHEKTLTHKYLINLK